MLLVLEGSNWSGIETQYITVSIDEEIWIQTRRIYLTRYAQQLICQLTHSGSLEESWEPIIGEPSTISWLGRLIVLQSSSCANKLRLPVPRVENSHGHKPS